MKYIDTFKLPTTQEINSYMGRTNYSAYPWTIFFQNQFEWVNCKDITIFYGNNGSGKSTLLNLIAEKINAQRNTTLFKDVLYSNMGDKIYPFDDFVNSIEVRMGIDDEGKAMLMPSIRKLITSDDIFNKIDIRTKHNLRAIQEIEEARNKKDEILNRGYEYYKKTNDYHQLEELLEASCLSKTKYAKKHASSKQDVYSNGETALDIFSNAFDSGGIYLLDEPENCLSPIFQIELVKLIEDASKYFDCQFIICTHSPLLLSIENALIYNLDLEPVIPQKWEELENVKLYYEFFKSKRGKFEK